MAELILRYLDHARDYYATKPGETTNEYRECVYSLRPLNHAFGPLPAEEFGGVGVESDGPLQEWLRRAIEFVGTLPAK